MDKFDIKSVSVLNTIKTFFKSDIIRNRHLLLLLLLFCTFRFVDNILGSILSTTSLYVTYTTIIMLFGLVIVAYLLLTALDPYNIFSRDRFLRSIILPIYQVKTLLAFVFKILPILLITSIVVVFLFETALSGFNIELTESNIMVFVYIVSGIMLFFVLPLCFSTYLVVTHDINGFNAIKLSKEIFAKNKKSSASIFIVLVFLPLVTLMAIYMFIDNSIVHNIAEIVSSIIMFFNHFIVANFLKEALISKENKTELLEA